MEADPHITHLLIADADGTLLGDPSGLRELHRLLAGCRIPVMVNSSRSVASVSAVSSTVRMPPSLPAVRGEGALSVNLLTPTTTCAPASMAARRRALDSTRRCFM